MTYNVNEKNCEAIRVAYLPFEGDTRQAPKKIPMVFRAIKGQTNGAPFFNFSQMDPVTKIGKVELCLPTREVSSNPAVQIKKIPATRALSVVHIGSYDTLLKAYQAIEAYALEQQFQLDSHFREVYLKGPGMIWQGKPEDYVTEIIIPIKEG
ncbi:GyrI-like domain-containing protein [Vagococcus sp. BWB3-3]|uniref:GyrI-like domain-containing protein n=1 Tax=Vagococcus allomyrinae TaxID=2794353 RepID=A0A940P627_9ENTE|nr:GyrI-like domain-containing protein [Vagococcus allomyrinae]MBP1042289.1 GyrI-like domain-containing protein [Vagococcus allomyrinae]